jgi:hypothetical protein
MKTYFTTIMMLLAFSLSAFGLSMDIRSPEIGCRANLGKKEQDTMRGVVEFMNKELSLIEGSFINELSNQRFGGSSAQVAAFIRLLRDAKLWQVQVVFEDFGEQNSALTLSQSSPESLRLCINSGREDFRLKDFKDFLPGVADPNAKAPKAEQVGAGQPATASESPPGGSQKPQSESKPAPR